MKKSTLLVLICTLVFSAVCLAAPSGSITLAGSTSVQPLAEELAKAYMTKYPAIKIAVQGGGSGAGIKAAIDGTADIGMCSRELNPDEKNLTATEIAKDGVTIIVNKANKLTNLSLGQLQKIYAGSVTEWKQVDPKSLNTKIVVVNREAGSGTRGAFEELVLGKLKNTSNCLVQSSTGAVQQTVAVTKEAVGYISLGSLDPKAVKAVTVNGVACNQANILSKKYLIQRPFLFLTKTAPTGVAKEFIHWILSPEGQKIVAKDFISIKAR
ncbi:MAG TPA: phosphate-binding protein [Firmicutes bacterium]|jgi:phosphate transport system substrate-binding protein|nr:phosphate-binding protein [Bacillota bacterium]